MNFNTKSTYLHVGNWEQAGWVAALLQGILGIKWRANRVTGSCRLERSLVVVLLNLLPLHQVAQGLANCVLNISRDGDSTPQPDIVLTYPRVGNFFLYQVGIICVPTCLLPIVLSVLLRRVALSSLHKYIVVGSNNSCHSLFSPCWPNPTPSVSPWPSCASAPWLPWWVSYWSEPRGQYLSCAGVSPKLDREHVVSQELERGKSHFPWLLA